MSYRLVTETRTGPLEGPVFRCYTDALGEAVSRLRNGITFVQSIYDGSGDLVKRIQPEGRRIKLRPPVELDGFESGSVVTPGLSLTGWTPAPNSAVEGGGLSPIGCTFDLAEGL